MSSEGGPFRQLHVPVETVHEKRKRLTTQLDCINSMNAYGRTPDELAKMRAEIDRLTKELRGLRMVTP